MVAPQGAAFIIPSFVCQDETVDFEHTYDLEITANAGTLRKTFVVVFRGKEVDAPPCVTQAMFINNSGFPADLRFFSNNRPVGINVLISGFPPNNVYLVEKDFQFDDLEVRFNSSTVPLGLVVPCGNRGVFTSNTGSVITTGVEPIPDS